MSEEHKPLNFIEEIIEQDLQEGFPKSSLRFRFPPEPNGYLHIGHAKAIAINFGLGQRYNAPVNLRFDDTNPAKEEQEYVDAIKRDIEWLGYKWDKEVYASDYFQQLYEWAVELIKEGKAYVDDQSSQLIAEQRKTPQEPGIESPFRTRTIEENLSLFEGMKNGDFDEGSRVLRAKVDMTSPNMNLRDPVMYRILKKHHHRTGTDWVLFPMYDWTHGESDYVEQVSHSLCSLEFKPHRPLYDWYLDQVYDDELIRPKQREFARGNVGYMITSKRKLLKLVEDNLVGGWDDPRMPTISGLRRRGYTAKSLIDFWNQAGVAKRDNLLDPAALDHSVRSHLNSIAPRVFVVLDPLKLTITNYPEDKEEILHIENNPEDDSSGNREVPFSKSIWIEKDDFREEANRKFFRLKLGGEVRLKGGYIIMANDVVKDADGNVIEVLCTYDEDSKSGSGTEASTRKVKGTLHWVSANHGLPVSVRLYDRLFTVPQPDKDEDFLQHFNHDSLEEITAIAEPAVKTLKPEDKVQFQRKGYFCVDKDSTAEMLVFNRTVTLRDTWAKIDNSGES